ncbi:ATP-binding protein [Streptomyces lycii]|uniref:ATP-binding protein n=1 Tax=Streptomyces lycii TaxID=2654337 RepID=A0ABQ7FD25_9ACTN|nr:ATP-binding protein [Streptomyces lycii]
MESALDQLGHEGELVSDAVLAVSELVANAVEHATGPYEIRLRCTGTELVCEVGIPAFVHRNRRPPTDPTSGLICICQVQPLVTSP